MATTEPGSPLSGLAANQLLGRIMAQREHRYTDAGPDMAGAGEARFRHEGSRLFVAYGRATPNNAERMVWRIITYAQRTSARIVWSVAECDLGAQALTSTLLARQFRLDERLTLMARQSVLPSLASPEICVAPISTWTEMWAYERGSRQAFYDDPTPETSVVTARASERWRQQQMGWYRYYFATFQGEFAGGAYVSQWEDVPTLMGVYTLERARNHGVASAAMARIVKDILVAGKQEYCLFVKDGNPAQRLYESLGFIALGAEATYLLDL